MGARYYFVKPVLPEAIVDRVTELLQEKHSEYVVANEVRGKRRVTSLDEKISNIFMTIGIPPHIKGYVFLREGIKLTVETPSIINSITKELYPKIAQKFDTSASKVAGWTPFRPCLA
jgi:two-component system response regulator (stage 0 sporulation protein A)